jgi:hypothetical protein
MRLDPSAARRTLRTLAVLGLLLPFGRAWGDEPAPAVPAKPPETTVKLLEAGAEPRAALRFQIPKGQRERATSTLRQRRLRPPVLEPKSTTLILTHEIKEAAPSGAYRYGMVLDELRMETGTSPDSSVGKALLAALATLKGATASATISDRGHVTDTAFPPHAGTLPLAEGRFEHALDQMQNLGSPLLPEEPVGIGARWEVLESITVDGAPFDSSVVCTLTAREKDRLDLDLVLKQTAQPHELPGQPAGTKIEVLSLIAHGSGKVTLDLTRLLPTKKSAKLAFTRKARVTTPKTKGEVEVVDEHAVELSTELLLATPVK